MEHFEKLLIVSEKGRNRSRNNLRDEAEGRKEAKNEKLLNF